MLDLQWWQTAVVYQIYPRSFRDANGDGVGDLAGIIEKLDYFPDLGVDTIWISPIFPSPMADFGYDVSDYRAIHPLFGSMDDFCCLISEAHGRGLKVLLDLVPNHTSDRHPWFEEALRSRSSLKRDWYIWHDPAPDGGPPNNWRSQFGGSAWEWDESTGQYYYHAFLRQQPDLNWRNPEVREAIYDVMRFWLDLGVDGFRVDVIWHLIKDDRFRDNPRNPDFRPGQAPLDEYIDLYTTDRPEVHDVIAEMRRVVDAYSNRVLIGEIYLPVEKLVTYYGADLGGTHLPFNFQLIECNWHAQTIAELIAEYERLLPEGAWPNWVLGNHDKPRIATRIGLAQARVAAMLLLTLRGTPTLYYGDEIAMENVKIAPDQVRDPLERNVLGLGRDPQRTPMQWDGSAHAGFSVVEPWLPVAANFSEMNVAAEREDDRSMLTLHRRLLALRRSEPALLVGSWSRVPLPGDILAYRRQHAEQSFLIVLNLSDEPEALVFPKGSARGRLTLSTHLDRGGETVRDELELRGDEGVVVALDQAVNS